MYGDIIVWTNLGYNKQDISGYNLSTKEEFWIWFGKEAVIYKEHVVWINLNKNNDIYLFGCNLNEKQQIVPPETVPPEATPPETSPPQPSTPISFFVLIFTGTLSGIFLVYLLLKQKE